jgi:hypothetical protein
MAQWGKSDAASNSVLWAPTRVKATPNTTNRDALFLHTTPDAFITGVTTGQFCVDANEIAVGAGNVTQIIITSGGSGYSGNTTASFSGGGGSDAAANAFCNTSTGRITAVNITDGGSSYVTNPTVTITAPSLITFNGNTAVTSNTIAVSSANSKLTVGDKVVYAGNATSTPIGLVNNTTYFVSFANSTVIALSATEGGANISITSAASASASAGGATLRGETATATAVVGGAKNKGVAHTGWNLRTVGSGGRAGRVQYETLVAMGTLNTDGNDDSVLPDA